MSENGEGLSPPSAAKMFISRHMSGPGREADDCISPGVVRRSNANADVTAHLDSGKRRRADACVERDFSVAALIKKGNDALELRQ